MTLKSSNFKWKLLSEKNRLETFKSWPFPDTAKCNPKKLAEAGFYKSGSLSDEDLVSCFLCGKELDGWEETDDPWQEHKSHASYCMFAQLGKAEENLTLLESFQINHQLSRNIFEKAYKEELEYFEKTIKDFKTEIKYYKAK